MKYPITPLSNDSTTTLEDALSILDSNGDVFRRNGTCGFCYDPVWAKTSSAQRIVYGKRRSGRTAQQNHGIAFGKKCCKECATLMKKVAKNRKRIKLLHFSNEDKEPTMDSTTRKGLV